ncbi:AP-3 complex subunit delta [Coemansia sp. RSA 552]|nr:AP-3 complex subunit delta [Coemansia sp. RSA 552]
MFEKSLTDLIQGLRANKRNEAHYIQRSLSEIQREVQASDMRQKSVAVDKLNYLHMLGYDMNWASFHVVEVMASPRLGEKRAGYLAATQSFHEDTDVLMLTTNLIRKDLASPNDMEVSVALDGLAQIATASLAQDLFDDVLAAAAHTRPYIRKKAVLCLYKLAEKYGEGLPTLVPVLKERMDDPDPGVVAAAVNVVCELARTDPHGYIALAPKLYQLLNSLTNNWILIKIVKLFASLTPIEPRLARKLHAPLAHLISNTSAMSLLYECVHTAVVGDIIGVPLPVADSLGREMDFAELCAQKLSLFYESRDHNLRYVGLVTLAQLQVRRPDLVSRQYDVVLACLDDPDVSIRMRAVDVISAMATRKTLVRIVKRLMSQLVLSSTVALRPENASLETESSAFEALPQTDGAGTTLVSVQGSISSPRRSDSDAADNPEYRRAAVEAILHMCSRDAYANMGDFEWYVATLVDLVYIAGVDTDSRLAERFQDVAVRVRQVRSFSVKMARRLLADKALSTSPQHTCVLTTAAYILGEYCPLEPSTLEDISLLLPARLAQFGDEQQGVFVQAAMKAYTNWLHDACSYWGPDVWERVRTVTASTHRALAELFMADAADSAATSVAAGLPLQVGARLRLFVEILKTVSMATSNMADAAPPVCAELHALFTVHELNPVSAAAQGKVPVPESLDLDAPVGTPIPDTSQAVLPPPEPSHAPARARRRSSHGRSGPFYLSTAAHRPAAELPDVDDIPVVALDLSDAAAKPRRSKTDKKGKSRRRRRRRTRDRSPSPPPTAPVDIAGDEDMPDAPGP